MTSANNAQIEAPARVLNFLTTQSSAYPTLARLAEDFNMQVTQELGDDRRSVFALAEPVEVNKAAMERLSPRCDSLQALEQFAKDNITDLLHSYLFGDSELALAE